MRIVCAYCGMESDKPASAVNRARKDGLPQYCNRTCAGLARRVPPRTLQQKRDEKAAYDRIYRKQNMPRHVEYCRRPEYKAYKARHDREYRAKKEYGEFWECAILALELRRECLERMTAHDIRQSNGLMNKALKRKRERYE